MSDSNLERILKLLIRSPMSQTALVQALSLSRSHVSGLVKSLTEQGFVESEEESFAEDEVTRGARRRFRLKIKTQKCCTAVVIHTLWEFSLSLFALGLSTPLVTLNLPRHARAADLSEELSHALPLAAKQANISPSDIKLMVFATQASLEQGYGGMVFRDNSLEDDGISLSNLLSDKLCIPVYVCNYAYAHLLCLLNSPNLNIDSAMALLCGEGSVALGIFIDKKISLGPHQTFPECSHLPYPCGFEKALGSYNEHTADALIFAVSALAPIYKLRRVILAGSCFENHPEVIASARRTLLLSENSLLRHTDLEYWPREIDRYREELVLLSFSELINKLSLTRSKRSLESLVLSQQPF